MVKILLVEDDIMSARCRIYLFTYNRNNLLVRAVDSLRMQTFTQWVCELHNDMPGNSFPEEYITSLDDPRFIVKNHEKNLGAVKSFNLAFEPCNEEFISILEDDNWWEPAFLETMLSTMDRHKGVQVAWANMNLWQEEQNEAWRPLNRAIWPITGDVPLLIAFPQYEQAFSALHSNGAMLVRSRDINRLKTPTDIRFDFIEHIRERAFLHPILFINEPLGNFSLTIASSRPGNKGEMHEYYFLLLASYFKYFKKEGQNVDKIWTAFRNNRIKSSHNLMYAGIIEKDCRSLLARASVYDWLFFIAYNIKYPIVFFRCIKAKKRHRVLWEYLDHHTRGRLNEKQMVD